MAVTVEADSLAAADPLTGIREALARVRQPTANARGMPNATYVDPRYFDIERRLIMAPGWACVGFVSDVDQPGYAKPISLMGLPLVILCDRQGEIGVFHNVCSHRGMRLVREAGPVGRSLRCPYHSWTYGLDGRLRGTAHIGGVGQHRLAGFPCERFGLRRVRSAVWMGLIFVNLSGDAPSLETHLDGLTRRWSQFVGDGLSMLRADRGGGALRLEAHCNWKLAMENYCEAYHLPTVHPALNRYSRLQDHYDIVGEDNFVGQGCRAYNAAEVAGTRLPRFPEWPSDRPHHAEYVALFPNVCLGLQADHAFAVVLEPVAHDRTLEHLRLFYVGDEALGHHYSAHREATLASWRRVFEEDLDAVEGLQLGRQSPAFEGGIFSPVMDTPTHQFHRWVACQLSQPV
ncbi:MAG TPA: aromatic ring-hydroxylating dioxygenase subunit alpha [Gammaproteobacteria bacterium]|nr:aromatic ring-hydroxylating dioxygenase subunit alpha [Gammaproteobacteria bacterium]